MFKYGHADLLRLFKQYQSANVIQNDMQKKLKDYITHSTITSGSSRT